MKLTTSGLRLAAIILAAGSIVSSCTDDKYDLSDIDTTTEIKVVDLTVPVNFKDITMDNIISVDDENPDAVIKVRTINGKQVFFFSKGGSFEANPKSIALVEAPAPEHIESTDVTISRVTPSGARPKAVGSEVIEYTITEYNTEFIYHVGSDGNPPVDNAIQTVADVHMQKDNLLLTTLTFSSPEIEEIASHTEIYDLVITVPENMTANYGDIKASNGRISIPHLTSTTGSLSIVLEVTNINFTTTEEPYGIKVVDGKFDFSEFIGVESGRFFVYTKPGAGEIPADITFHTDYDMSDFTVDKFSGKFNYDVDFSPIEPFDLSDLPEFLAGKGTNIILADPALTLNVNNPIAIYGLSCETGLTLTAIREDEQGNVISETPEVLPTFDVNDQRVDQFHVMAPSTDAMNYLDLPVGLPVEFTTFEGLSRILAGDGIPTRVGVEFTSSQLPEPSVTGMATNFPLGENIPQVHGDYTFSAPLALEEGSVVIYTKTIDGWSDEDVDAINISSLTVNAVVSSTIPAGADITVRPINTKGDRIPLTDASKATIHLDRLADNQAISITVAGEIRDLDGLYIEAVVQNFNGNPISPDETIKITDLRATVSGTYTKKL